MTKQTTHSGFGGAARGLVRNLETSCFPMRPQNEGTGIQINGQERVTGVNLVWQCSLGLGQERILRQADSLDSLETSNPEEAFHQLRTGKCMPVWWKSERITFRSCVGGAFRRQGGAPCMSLFLKIQSQRTDPVQGASKTARNGGIIH